MKQKLIELSIKEVNNLNFHHINRCGFLDVNEAIANGFSHDDCKSFVNRCEKMLKEIKKNGFLMNSFLCVAVCKDDGKLYLVDGQGRRGAIQLGIIKGDISTDFKVPCIMLEGYTYDEIGELIRKFNNAKSSPWKGLDRSFADAKQKGGDYLTAYNIVKNYAETHKCNIYMSRLLHFGQKGSHSKGNPLTLSDFRSNNELFTSLYSTFLSDFGKIFEGTHTHLKKKRLGLAKKTDLGIIWESLINHMTKFKSSNTDLTNNIINLNNEIIKKSNKLSMEDFIRLVHIKKDDKSSFKSILNIGKIIDNVYKKTPYFDEVKSHYAYWDF